MENLNTILNLNLSTDSIFKITEENLVLFKKEDYYTKCNLFFFLQNSLFKSKNKPKEYCYINYLISYYLMVILTPVNYEELAYNYILEALNNSENIKYKE